MRIALAQINASMGAIEANTARIGRFLDQAESMKADLTVFPELAVVGYPPKDLLEQGGFVKRGEAAVERLAKEHPMQRFVLGFVESGTTTGKGRFNSAAYIEGGKVRFIQRKRLLPTYDVFDEARYFDPGEKSEPTTAMGEKIGITICEDIWTEAEFLGRKLYNQNPIEDLKAQGAKIILNLSSSPYHSSKPKVREKLIEKLIERYALPLVYVNLVGGNDELLFDGGSLAVDAEGTLRARLKSFEEDLVVVDFKSTTREIRPWPTTGEEWSAQALVMGLRDYVRKCGFQKVVIGLSGGIDSSLVALLAVEASGVQNVAGVSMPSRFTSEASNEDAETLAKKLGIQWVTIPIEPAMKAFDESLSESFRGRPRDTTEENLQARIRGNLLMALSNKFSWLVLSTGNKSELAVGYCTQYGDMAGGLGVISDLPKVQVYKIARFLNDKYRAIPKRVFERPPTAELRPDQKDEDSLPPYETLDPILEMYVEDRKAPDEIIRAGFDRATVERVVGLVDRNEFKRKQAAPGLRLSEKAFGVGRRMPIARGPA